MTYKQSLQPPPKLFGADTAGPDARTIVAEVRSDASLPFNPLEAPQALELPAMAFGAFIVWRADLSWSEAQQIQLWLSPPQPGGISANEAQLKSFFENLRTDAAAEPFLRYLGTYLTTGTSNASYMLVLGMLVPTGRKDYQDAFANALNAVVAGGAAFAVELVRFLKMLLNHPSSREEFLTNATNVGDLAQPGPQRSPLVRVLIT